MDEIPLPMAKLLARFPAHRVTEDGMVELSDSINDDPLYAHRPGIRFDPERASKAVQEMAAAIIAEHPELDQLPTE